MSEMLKGGVSKNVGGAGVAGDVADNFSEAAPDETQAKCKIADISNKLKDKAGKGKDKAVAPKPEAIIGRQRYKGKAGRGTVGDSRHMIDTYQGWAQMLKDGKASPSQQRVINGMSPNEGGLDAVQAYEWGKGAPALTAGAMQKTTNTEGTGELSQQIKDFRTNNPTKYQELFADKGWTVEGGDPKPVKDKKGNPVVHKTGPKKGQPVMKTDPPKLYYKDPLQPKMAPITGKPLQAYLQDTNKIPFADTALQPFMDAGRDPEFQKQQVTDFQKRLDGRAAKDNVPSYGHPTGSYLTSETGRAVLLDQSVNAPNAVGRDLGKALDQFYAANPTASKDPGTWTPEQRAAYEPQILDNYAGHPAVPGNPKGHPPTKAIAATPGTRRMTDPTGRRNRILKIANNGHLSSVPGSYVPPP